MTIAVLTVKGMYSLPKSSTGRNGGGQVKVTLKIDVSAET